ncbi:MAG: ribonuclease HII [Thermoplasmatota archaeon]
MFLGVDEAGRGPVLGPLVIGGIVSGDQEGLRKEGVRDSKELSPPQREALYDQLSSGHYHCVMVVPAAAIDASRKVMTMNRLEVVCFSSVILSMLLGRSFTHPDIKGEVEVSLGGKRTEIGSMILDAADVDENRFGEAVLSEVSRFADIGGIGILSRHKADRDHPVVGAASILAKVVRDSRMKEISSEAGLDVGSGYPSDPLTQEYLADYVQKNGSLPPQSRVSWETSRALMAKRLQRTLMDF